MNLEFSEQIYFFAIGIALLIILIRNYSGDFMKLWSPLTMVALTMIYYVVIGPAIALTQEEGTIYRLIDHRGYFLEGWQGALLFLVFLILGYSVKTNSNHKKIRVTPSNSSLKKVGIRLFIIGFIFFFVAVGFNIFNQINFLDGSAGTPGAGGYKGSFRNYFQLSINFWVVANCMLLVAYLRRELALWLFLLILGVSAGIYISGGFRYRLVLLGFSLIATYFLETQRKPKLLLLAIIGFGTLIVMGIIGIGREYGKGINVDVVESKSYFDLFMVGFDESYVFQTTGYLIEDGEELFGYTGFDLITNTFAMPIPRKIWPSKPDGSYLLQINYLYGYTGHGAGVAVLNYGEYYLSFGWMGIVVIGFILGYVFKILWLWFYENRDNVLAKIALAASVSYIYVVISRGYLPQVVMLFFFSVFPIFFIIRLYNRGKIE